MSHHNPTYKDTFTDVHQKLLQDFSDQLINNPSKRADVRLAAGIISGEIDSQRFAAGLLRILGSMILKTEGGQRRRNTGTSLPNVSGEDFSEIAFTLSGLLRNKHGMRMFGIQPRHLKPLQLSHPLLPDFYMSHVNPQMLIHGTSRSLANLKVSDTRNYVLAHDETVVGVGR